LLEGIRTKIVQGGRFHAQEKTSVSASARFLPINELWRAAAAKEQYAYLLMANSAFLGIGAGASADSPGEGAVIIYVDRERSNISVPATLNGVRTRVVTTSRFHSLSGAWVKQVSPRHAQERRCLRTPENRPR